MQSKLHWTRSSYCADATCVEVAPAGEGRVAVRDAKFPGRPHLQISRSEWHAFLDQIQAGRYRDI